MKTLDHRKLDVVNQTRSNFFGWRGQFELHSKPTEFERFGKCGECATIKIWSNPVEFDGIENPGDHQIIQLNA